MQAQGSQSNVGSLRSNYSDNSLPNNHVMMHCDESSGSPHSEHNDYSYEKTNLESTASNSREHRDNQLSRLKSEEYVVPKNQRRGLLPQLAIIPEFKDARDYPPMMKKDDCLLDCVFLHDGPHGHIYHFSSDQLNHNRI